MVFEFTDLECSRIPELTARTVRLLTTKKPEKHAACIDFLAECKNAGIERITAMRLAYGTIERALDDVSGDFEGGPIITEAQKRAWQREALDWFLKPLRGEWSFATCVDLLGQQARNFRDEAIARYQAAEDRWKKAAA